jgi:branched-chain amino acid transport system substrate-binding protein
MKKNVLFLICIGLALMLLLSAISCSSASTSNPPANASSTATASAERKTYTLGVCGEFTGFLGTWDTLQLNEAQIAVDMINARGGVTVGGQTYNLKLLPEDGKSDLDGTTSAANKLMGEGVKFVTGPNAFFGVAVGKIFEQNQIMHILGWCTAQPNEMDASTTWSFLGGSAAVEHFIAGMNYMKANYPQIKKVAIVMADDGGIPYIGKIVKQMLIDNGYTIAGDIIGFDNNAIDFNPYSAKVVATGADAAIMVDGLVPSDGSIIKGMRDLGNNMYAFVCLGMDPNDVLKVVQDAGKNVVNAGFWPGAPDQTALMQEYITKVRAKYGNDMTISAQYANPVFEYAQAFNAANSFDPEAVRTALLNTKVIEALQGPGNLGGLKTYGINHAIVWRVPIATLDSNTVTFKEWVQVTVP